MKKAFVLLSGILLVSCKIGGSSESKYRPQDPPPKAMIDYQVDITRTQYGVPHINAENWGSLGFGSGYAFAQDNYCVLMREIVFANGQSQRYFGDEGGDIASDFVFTWLGRDARDLFYDQQPERLRQLMRGYADGLNLFLDETGIDALAEGDAGCRNADWVRPVSVDDLAKVARRINVRLSTAAAKDLIYAAVPSKAEVKVAKTANRLQDPTPAALEALAKTLRPEAAKVGSNAYALGAEVTQSGSGMLLGNPHFPWQGGNRFYMQHQTMGDEYDVMGVALYGSPIVNIGFNRELAWTHTVSTGARFALLELALDPEDQLRYLFDGESRAFEAQAVTIEVQTADGVEERKHTFYLSHLGPVIDLSAYSSALGGWPYALSANGDKPAVFVFSDINVENNRSYDQWISMGQAQTVDAFQQSLNSIGIPWVNTLAADRDGNAFYGDISAVAHISNDKRQQCVQGPIAQLLTEAGLVTLNTDGADCTLGQDEDAPVAGIFGRAQLPSLMNRSYAANANDSYWLANADTPLEGYARTIGEERGEQYLRTRLTFLQVEQRLDGSDGLGEAGFTQANLQQIMFQSRNLAAELLVPALTSICDDVGDWSLHSSSPAVMSESCDVLAAWDRQDDLDSVGVPIFREFWKLFFQSEHFSDFPAVPFDPADPVHTPRGAQLDNPVLVAAMRDTLVAAVDMLLENNIALDAPLSDLQYTERNRVRYPIHGGPTDTSFSVISSELVKDEGYSAIDHGNSYLQTVSWENGAECPSADILLSYSQSTDPTSNHYADMTQLYSDKQWHPVPFCADAVAAQAVGEMRRLELSVEE